MTDPNWPTAGAWLAGDHATDATTTLQVVGAPVRLGSISGGRFDLAPAAIRAALSRFSTFDGDVDVRQVRIRDAGDLRLADATPEASLDEIAGAVGGSLPHADAVLVLGGDNSISRGVARGMGPGLERVGVLTFDAHHDLRDTSEGLTNGNPIRALLEDGLPGEQVAQIGIQPFANSRAYAEVARDAEIHVVTVDDVRRQGIDAMVARALSVLDTRVDAIHVDLDVDVLDRAFAPACPGSRPGGLTPAEIQAAARQCGAHPKVRAMDVVEVDPTRDVAEATALAAASFVLAFAAGLAARGSAS